MYTKWYGENADIIEERQVKEDIIEVILNRAHKIKGRESATPMLPFSFDNAGGKDTWNIPCIPEFINKWEEKMEG